MPKKTTLGLTEDVTVIGSKDERVVHARIDTGATLSSMDARLAAELKLGPVEKVTVVRNANGRKVRPVIEATIRLGGRDITTLFSLADRSHMRYRILVGQNILKQGFLIDPEKNTLVDDDVEVRSDG